MSAVDLHRPEFDATAAERLAVQLYGITTTAVELPGERDRNYHLKADDGREFVLKIANVGEDPKVLDFQLQMMRRLVERGLAGRCPAIVESLAEKSIESILCDKNRKHWVRLLTYLPGEPLANIKYHTPGLLRSLGDLLGRISGALAGFEHEAARRDFHWDLQHVEKTIGDNLSYLADSSKRSIVEDFLTRYRLTVVPRLGELRRSVIHNDANDYNILVGSAELENGGIRGKRVRGILDFGDAVFSHTINEPAIGMAYAMLGKSDPVAAASFIAEGFNRRFPITEKEADLLFCLACMRLCLSVTVCAFQQHQEPGNEYLRITERPAWKLLTQLQQTDFEFARFRLRAACGYSPTPNGCAVVSWLKDRERSPAKVIDWGPGHGGIPAVNLNFSNPNLAQNDYNQPCAAATQLIHTASSRGKCEILMGRYGEIRIVADVSDDVSESGDALGRREFHLGLDLFAQAGTTVYAALTGEVAEVYRNSERDEAAILLRHDVDNGRIALFTLYAHLAVEGDELIDPGVSIDSGGKLGRIASGGSRRNSMPHLHFQIITEQRKIAGIPHYCPVAQREIWQSLCPDPTVMPGMPLSMPTTGQTKQQLVEKRRRYIGPSLSISYQQPLKIVRGFKQYLYDENGRAYLDAVNNVPHVGHCHPEVVAAAHQQLAILNTNTRYLHDYLVEYAERLTSLLPDPLEVCFFVCSGSEANELAIRLAKSHTGGTDFIVVDGAYHGNTGSLIDLSPYKFDGPGGRGAPPHVHTVPTPDPYRGKHKAGTPDLGERYAAYVAEALRQLVSSGKNPAAFFCESILGCAGQIVLPGGYLEAAYRHVHEAGGVCVADEVQVGFGRVGSHFWAFETQQVTPDIVTLGKPIGNGHPLAAVITTREIASSFADGMEYFNTYGGNPVSCAVGLAVLDVLEKEKLQENAYQVGSYLRERLNRLKDEYAMVGDVRGLGLFIGIELVLDPVMLTPATEYASYVVEKMKDRKVLVSTDGPLENVIKIKPPLVFSQKNADRLADTLEEILYDGR